MLQAPVLAGPPPNPNIAQLGELRAKAADLKLRVSDLTSRRTQLGDRYDRFQGSEADRIALGKELAGVQHDLTAAQVQLETTTEQIDELTTQRDMERAFSLQGPPGIATVAPPIGEPFPRPNDIMAILGGGALLLFPFILVLARRLWVRGTPRPTIDLEDSPRLQRIEQAIESIAVEVERIGEAQRFTTKLLADRQPDAAARLAAIPRKEPGTITPH